MTAKDADEAVSNASAISSYAVGMCLQYVRGPCWEIGSFYGSAIDAWYGAKHKHPGDRNPPKGAPCFYSGGSYGHIVIAKGGRMRSTDCTSSGRVSDADLSWPEANWNDTYLGWAEDLNGVTLPLDTGDGDNGDEDDDMPQYDHAGTSKALNLKAKEWFGITWANVASGKAFTAGSTACKLGGRTYEAVLHVTVEAPSGSTIRLRTVEVENGEVVESNPVTEVTANAGGTYALHVQSGVVSKGRDLRFRVSSDAGGKLTAADATVLSW